MGNCAPLSGSHNRSMAPRRLAAALLTAACVVSGLSGPAAAAPTTISTVAGGGSGTGATGASLTNLHSVTAAPVPVPFVSDGFGLVDGCAARWVTPAAGSDTGPINTQLGAIGSCTGTPGAIFDQVGAIARYV